MGRPVESTGLPRCSCAGLPLVAKRRRGSDAGDGGRESRTKGSSAWGSPAPVPLSSRQTGDSLSLALVLGLLPATGPPVPTTQPCDRYMPLRSLPRAPAATLTGRWGPADPRCDVQDHANL